VGAWKAQLALEFAALEARSVLSRRESEGPLVVQKPLYPEGPGVCHAIVVHPPGGIAGDDELSLDVRVKESAAALLTSPGAAKWYRSAGPWAKQKLSFDVHGLLEWLPRETIVFDGALAQLSCEVRLGEHARYIGWEIVCLGRTGSGERFESGRLRIDTRVLKGEKLIWLERGEIEGGGALMRSPIGLGGSSVFGSLVAAAPSLEPELVRQCKEIVPTTLLPGVLLARYLGNSTEDAMRRFTALWHLLRPTLAGRPAVEPRIWRT
jgi:urease accessory protein